MRDKRLIARWWFVMEQRGCIEHERHYEALALRARERWEDVKLAAFSRPEILDTAQWRGGWVAVARANRRLSAASVRSVRAQKRARIAARRWGRL